MLGITAEAALIMQGVIRESITADGVLHARLILMSLAAYLIITTGGTVNCGFNIAHITGIVVI